MHDLALAEAYQKLFQALHHGGLGSICRAAFELVGRPILIVNEELKKLQQYPDKPLGDPIWDSLLETGTMTQAMIWQLREEELMEESEKSEVPLWTDWGMTQDVPRLVLNVKINGVIEGYVSFFYPGGRYSDRDAQILILVAQAVGLELEKKGRSESGRYPTILTAFINDLFHGAINTESLLSRWEKSMGRQLKPPFYVVVVGGDERVNTTLYHLRSVLSENAANSYALVMEGKLYILFTSMRSKLPEADILPTMLKRLEDALTRYGLGAGISERFDRLLDLDKYKYQAERALSLGQLHFPNLRSHAYRELVLEDLLAQVRANVNSANFMHPAIAILRDYDRLNHTEYLLTLKTYIQSMCNPARTIKKMHIHRNTLLYRLNKIVELTGIALEDERTCALLINNFYLAEDIMN